MRSIDAEHAPVREFRRELVGFVGRGARDERRGNTGEMEPGSLGSPADLEIARVVFQIEGDRVATLQTQRPEQLRALVRPILEFSVGDDFTGSGHDDRGFVGVGARVVARMQDFLPFDAFLVLRVPYSAIEGSLMVLTSAQQYVPLRSKTNLRTRRSRRVGRCHKRLI
jgi:hypothetical protein